MLFDVESTRGCWGPANSIVQSGSCDSTVESIQEWSFDSMALSKNSVRRCHAELPKIFLTRPLGAELVHYAQGILVTKHMLM